MMAFSPMVVKLQIAPDKGMLAVGPMVATLPLAPERGMISFGPITVKLQAAPDEGEMVFGPMVCRKAGKCARKGITAFGPIVKRQHGHGIGAAAPAGQPKIAVRLHVVTHYSCTDATTKDAAAEFCVERK